MTPEIAPKPGVHSAVEKIGQRVASGELVLVASLPVFATPEQDAESNETIRHYRDWAGPEHVATLTGPKGGRPGVDSPLAMNVYVDMERWLELHPEIHPDPAIHQVH